MNELKYYFERAGVPWIYTQDREEVHTASAYNRRPKGTKFSNNYESKLQTIRKKLSEQPEKLEKLRMDRANAKTPTRDEQTWHQVLKAIKAEETASKYKSASPTRKGKVKEDDGIVEKRGSPVKKNLGQSKGGNIKKKQREATGLQKEMMSGKGLADAE